MKKVPNKRPCLALAVFLLLGTLPFMDLRAFGQDDLAANPAVPYATAVPKSEDLKSAPVTVYHQVDGHPFVTWGTLAHFNYDAASIDEEIDPKLRLKKKKRPIPGFIRDLDGKSIAVIGFMIPIDANDAGDKTTSFIIARSQASCCYGIVPKMNEWIFVQMGKGKDADILMDCPVTVFGTLSVGEEKKKDQGWTFYRMMGEKVKEPKF